MLLAHAVTLAEARSYLAALADHAGSTDASLQYDRVLLQLDSLHGDDIPGISPVPVDDAGDQGALFAVAESAIEDLTGHGMDALTVELVLDMLSAARELDKP
jgi:hypothetical protein